MKKKLFGLLACMLAMLMLLGCGAKPAEPAPEAEKPAEETPAEPEEAPAEEEDAEPIKMTLLLPSGDPTWDPVIEDMIREKFPQVEFVFKMFDTTQGEKTIKTAFAGGEAIDVSLYWPNQINNFVSADMALDMTPYLDADPEWKASFAGTSLQSGEIDGHVYAVPFGTVYPMVQLNLDILEAAGVEPKDQWTWEEFADACDKIAANTDAFPVGVSASCGNWFNRNVCLQVWDNDAEVDAFAAGDVSFTDERVKAGFDKVAALYEKNYFYPGESALTTSGDQVRAAFVQGKIGILCNVNTVASSVASNIGDSFPMKVASWPTMAPSAEQDHLLGGNDGFMVTSNTKHPDLAMEIVKFLTSPETIQLRVNKGMIPTILGVESTDPYFAEYGKDADKVYPREVINVSSEVQDYFFTGLPANYIMYGDTCLEELDELRLAGLEE